MQLSSQCVKSVKKWQLPLNKLYHSSRFFSLSSQLPADAIHRRRRCRVFFVNCTTCIDHGH